MIGTRDIKLHAANPNLPLAPFFAHVASPSSLRILNVPKKIGLWEITNVFVTVVYPDNSAHSVEAVKSGGVYVATVDASAAPGVAKNGLEITANGLDENGERVEGYVLGTADVYILDRDGSITVGETTYYIRLVDSKPATPHKGDVVKSDDGWEIFDGSAWISLGGGEVSWEDITDKPMIPDEVTEETVSGWGFFSGTIETIKNALSTVFAALKHNHEQSEVIGLEMDLLGKLDKFDVVAPAADRALKGRAADAYETGKKLDSKVDKGSSLSLNNEHGSIVLTNDWGSLLVQIINNEAIYFKAKNKTSALCPDGTDVATLAKISGITANDITDFLHYKGECFDDRWLSVVELKIGDIAHSNSFDAYVICNKDCPIGTYIQDCGAQYIPTDGFLRLLDLFGQSNSQLAATIRAKVLADGEGEIKAALFTDAAMKIERVVRNFNRDAVNESAIMKSFKIPQYLKSRLAGKTLKAIRMQGPTTATGPWDSTDVALLLTSEPLTTLIPATSEIEVGKPVEFVKDAGFSIDTDDDYIHILSPLGQSKFGLVPVDSSLGYDIEAANGKHITNYAPFLEFVEKDGTVISTAVNDVMSTLVDAGAVSQLATNATQSQIIAKVNELISKLREV